MAAFGTLTLLIALVVATYAGTASLIAPARESPLIPVGRAARLRAAAVLGLSSVALVYSFLTTTTRSSTSPLLDAGRALLQIPPTGRLDDRSCGGCSCCRVLGHRRVLRTASAPRAAAVRGHVRCESLTSSCTSSSFTRTLRHYLTTSHVGQGLNPLLQNAYMVCTRRRCTRVRRHEHPVRGRLAALIGSADDAWIASVRSGTLAWFSWRWG